MPSTVVDAGGFNLSESSAECDVIVKDLWSGGEIYIHGTSLAAEPQTAIIQGTLLASSAAVLC